MDRRAWTYVAIIAVAIAVCVVALWWAGVTPLAVTGGGTVKVPLAGGWEQTAANGLDVYRLTYTSAGVYIYSLAYNSSIGLATKGTVAYLLYPAWNKRVTFTWKDTSASYAVVKVSVT